MSVLEAIFFGILQGITEFLPVSSSGHLAVAKNIFNLNDVPVIFDILLHMSTLLAVCLFFWRQIFDLICAFARFILKKSLNSDKPKLQMIVALVVGTVVTGIIGILSTKLLPETSIKFVYVGFLITACLLIVSSVRSNKNLSKNQYIDANSQDLSNNVAPNVTVKQGLLVGVAQGIGTFPGISRSGITISAALFSGINRKTAGEFSFLLSIPAILGAFILEVGDLKQMSSNVGILPLLIGCIVAFGSGIVALKFLMTIIRAGKLQWFACYLIPLGIIGLLFL